jgi:hypothetical protein
MDSVDYYDDASIDGIHYVIQYIVDTLLVKLSTVGNDLDPLLCMPDFLAAQDLLMDMEMLNIDIMNVLLKRVEKNRHWFHSSIRNIQLMENTFYILQTFGYQRVVVKMLRTILWRKTSSPGSVYHQRLIALGFCFLPARDVCNYYFKNWPHLFANTITSGVTYHYLRMLAYIRTRDVLAPVPSLLALCLLQTVSIAAKTKKNIDEDVYVPLMQLMGIHVCRRPTWANDPKETPACSRPYIAEKRRRSVAGPTQQYLLSVLMCCMPEPVGEQHTLSAFFLDSLLPRLTLDIHWNSVEVEAQKRKMRGSYLLRAEA